MIIVQIIQSGLQLLSKVILDGTSVFSFIAYRQITTAVTIAPLVYFFERTLLENITQWIVLWILINSLIKIPFFLGLFYVGLAETTATYGTIFLCLILVATFALSIVFRPKNSRFHNIYRKLKVGGATCLAGALVVVWDMHFGLWHRLPNMYPSKYWSIVFPCLMGSVESVIVCWIWERDPTSWRFDTKRQILTFMYSGVLVSGANSFDDS